MNNNKALIVQMDKLNEEDKINNRIIFSFNDFDLLESDKKIYAFKFYIDNPSVSPYFIMCLLWYPAFENLFSIIRKKINQISFETPDKKHFHHFLFNFIGLKIRINKEIVNTISGNVIAIYNLIYFFIIKDYYFFTLGLVLSCIINISLYISVYFFL